MMKAVAVASLCVFAVLPAVLGHATLISPAPFGTPNSPSKTSPTGGGSVGTPAYPYTGAQFLTWKLIANDGNGPVRMVINRSPQTTAFTSATTAPNNANLVVVPLTPVLTTPYEGTVLATYGTADPALGPQVSNNNPFGFTFNVPAGITCSGSMGAFQNSVCTVQLSSSSSWYSGFAFSTAPPAVATSTGTSQATVARGACQAPSAASLQTCSSIVTGIRAVNGASSARIWVPEGETQATMDASVLAEFSQNLVNPNVFSINTDAHTESVTVETPCSTSYKRFLCAQAFTPCNPANTQPVSGAAAQPCGPNCDEFTCWCNLNPKHAFLYTCTAYQQAGRDSTGACAQYPNVRGFGPNNSTCVRSNNNANGLDDGGAAPRGATLSPLLAVALAVIAWMAMYVQ